MVENPFHPIQLVGIEVPDGSYEVFDRYAALNILREFLTQERIDCAAGVLGLGFSYTDPILDRGGYRNN